MNTPNISFTENDVVLGKKGLEKNRKTTASRKLRQIVKNNLEANVNADFDGRRKMEYDIMVQAKKELPSDARFLKYVPEMRGSGNYRLASDVEAQTAIGRIFSELRYYQKRKDTMAAKKGNSQRQNSHETVCQDSTEEITIVHKTTNYSPACKSTPRRLDKGIDTCSGQNNDSLDVEQLLNDSKAPPKIKQPPVADAKSEHICRQPCTASLINEVVATKATTSSSTKRPAETIIMSSHKKARLSLPDPPDSSEFGIIINEEPVEFNGELAKRPTETPSLDSHKKTPLSSDSSQNSSELGIMYIKEEPAEFNEEVDKRNTETPIERDSYKKAHASLPDPPGSSKPVIVIKQRPVEFNERDKRPTETTTLEEPLEFNEELVTIKNHMRYLLTTSTRTKAFAEGLSS